MIMMRYSLILPFLMVLGGLSAQKELDTDIDSLTLFLNGGSVHRSETVRLEEGKNELRFTGLSPKLRGESVRMELASSEGLRILSVSDHEDHFTSARQSKKVDRLRSRLEAVKREQDSLSDIRDAFLSEKKMLLSNKDIGGEGSNISAKEMKEVADLYRKRMQKINRERSRLNRKIEKLKKKKERLYDQLKGSNAKAKTRTSEVEVILVADEAIETELELNYLVNGTGWAPFYDLRAEDLNGPVKLEYRARVFNDTDVDWENVELTLSTGVADQGISKPKMDRWTIDPYEVEEKSWGSSVKSSGIEKESEAEERPGSEEEGDEVRFKQVRVSELSPDFEIENTYSIPSNSKPYIVDVTEYELSAVFKHYAIPKKEEGVFLLAGITGWEDLGLIEGEANVYFNGNYKGSSYIVPRGFGDTLNLSMGKDKKVQVDRKLQKEYSSSQLIGSKRKDEMTYALRVKNNRSHSIDLELIDQHPISQVDDVDISILELSGAERDPSTGQLTWDIEVESGESRRFDFSYEIKYPKERDVPKKKYRTISCPSF